MTHSKLKSQHNGKDSKTDDICKGIDLDPEAFLFLRSVFLVLAIFPSNISHSPENARQHTAAEIWSVTAQKIPIMEETTLM